jgi:hypothetical protein
MVPVAGQPQGVAPTSLPIYERHRALTVWHCIAPSVGADPLCLPIYERPCRRGNHGGLPLHAGACRRGNHRGLPLRFAVNHHR